MIDLCCHAVPNRHAWNPARLPLPVASEDGLATDAGPLWLAKFTSGIPGLTTLKRGESWATA